MKQSNNDYGFSASFTLASKTILVTGASGQLGSGIVCGLVARGANVLAVDVSIESLQAARNRWNWPDDRVELEVCDIRNRSDIRRVISVGENVFGGIDMLVNNAGVSVFEPYLERPESSIDWVMDVNIKGTILCIQEFTNHRVKKLGGGVIVNISSHYGVISPDPRIYTDLARKNSEVYGASKAGIIQMTRYFAVHLAEHRIRVNAVSPGGIRNPDSPQGSDFQSEYGFRCPLERMAETNEIVEPILFLLAPASSYVNGHNIVADGAMSCW